MKTLILLLSFFLFSRVALGQTNSTNSQSYPLYYKHSFWSGNRFVDERGNVVTQRNLSALLKNNPDTKQALNNGRILRVFSIVSLFIGAESIVLGANRISSDNPKTNQVLVGGGIGLLGVYVVLDVLKNKQFRKASSLYNTQHNFAYRPTFGATQNGVGLVLKW